jgi:hypothetical protein
MVATLWVFALPTLFPSCVSIAASWRVTLGTLHVMDVLYVLDFSIIIDGK